MGVTIGILSYLSFCQTCIYRKQALVVAIIAILTPQQVLELGPLTHAYVY